MNADHADAVDLYAAAAVPDAGSGWRMTGIDPEGIDLQREGVHGRVDFDSPVIDGETARMALVALVNALRAA